ncbi:hypothetical protein CJD36_020295 [Flavipsychrobacter stenotrophus]|uniref:DUF4249 domain-containing protein n=1 Tax=Flavipsychrobacter stenotrophus TaxID=2077091 RepID=A0A2S7SR99_9BACT|nr:DUF4249 family protein [Flavipsychrobacter stenotrophus]PQJ09137.1 hypothetical protein CJD36_020295 [Flavipsychrobacter stenotrophus]
MKSLYISSIFLLLTTLVACRKVIKVDLNASTPRYIVVGNITDKPGPYHVKITKSLNFDQDNNFQGVSNAQVLITDITLSVTDTLTEESSGNYVTHSILGINGHVYSLKITSGNNIFSATSTLPAAVHLDDLYTEKAALNDNLDVVPVFNDPAEKGNYFHLLLTVADSISPQIMIIDDGLINGQKIMTPIYNKMKFASGDAVSVELQCVDKGVFNYYSDLQQTEAQNLANPANPQSNITGGALGYFSAHTVNKMTIIVP